VKEMGRKYEEKQKIVAEIEFLAVRGAVVGDIEVKIEEAVTKKNLPLYGILIKMSLIEASSPMTKDVLSGTDRAFERVKELIAEKTGPGARILLVGVGNTMGVK
jgi:hypothetical protein